ncbi:hypothetical protein F5B20DRAFT_572852 [Whalleya microplaca]|nr:hypothetical protein F5B20DRAFT_572852 [Whalleya microplaca]
MAQTQLTPAQPRRQRRNGVSTTQRRSCPHCSRDFKRSEHLERHVRTHTKEKPYVCHCGTAYARRDLLTRHERISHETLSPRSPEETQQVLTESDPPPVDSNTAVSIPDMGLDHNIQQPHYADQNNIFGIPNHAVNQQYHHLVTTTTLNFYGNGQAYSPGFDQFQEYPSVPDRTMLPSEWTPYFHSHNAEQELVDPALRLSVVEESSSINDDDENFPGHPYSSWTSQSS